MLINLRLKVKENVSPAGYNPKVNINPKNLLWEFKNVTSLQPITGTMMSRGADNMAAEIWQVNYGAELEVHIWSFNSFLWSITNENASRWSSIFFSEESVS